MDDRFHGPGQIHRIKHIVTKSFENPTFTEMDQLPQSLQTEIWEYLRGDRRFWKSRFTIPLKFFCNFKGDLLAVVHAPTETGYRASYHVDVFMKHSQPWHVTAIHGRGGVLHNFLTTDPEEAMDDFIAVCNREHCDDIDDDTF
jgi:hypothetical protein